MENNWADITKDMAIEIAEHLDLVKDFEAFAKVCLSWGSASKEAKKPIELPWLMLSDPDDAPYRTYYSLAKRTSVKIDLPLSVLGPDKDDQTRRYFSSQGWLISMSRKNRRVTLFHPFSKTVIDLPRLSIDQIETAYDEWLMLIHCFTKFVLSTSLPHAEANQGNDYAIAMIYELNRQLAFWTPGKCRWVKPSYDVGCNRSWFYDVCFFKDEFYAIDCRGFVVAFGGLNGQNNQQQQPTARVVADLGTPGLVHPIGMDNVYLLGSESESELGVPCLLVVHRKRFSACNGRYVTSCFGVVKLNLQNGQAKEVRTLGNRAIFVGFNSTFSVMVSENDHENRCKVADCIYYTDDNSEEYTVSDEYAPDGGGKDMGIYSLPLGKHLRIYEGPLCFSFVNPPTWVQFSGST